MRKIISAALAMAAALTGASAAFAQTATWQYGAGNGDPVPYQGPKPTYSYAYGPGNGDNIKPGTVPQTGFAYGGDNQKGGMVQMTAPPPAQQSAAPRTVRPGDHS